MIAQNGIVGIKDAIANRDLCQEPFYGHFRTCRGISRAFMFSAGGSILVEAPVRAIEIA
jgi:hypothetical protein